uniref:Uncharacterized protein n=1 Tax=Grammatophora oceanica TaxID=210454 RepID=A0A7S1YLQ6_9STRA|mmetsp:Transcript_8069/g.11791  ORF Transcript_8069/g.11791 Transcript_8069/m.11791 type:complete len:210 (+) Transcript_8069:159-788(+)|eukprot:CAMPEP_0194047262 /NCGR_PEP_ID=MMETSP0009_2-20130614/23711_1 /TAXON_ID=210454 /ORGANISM="Grammatophora oceanica, Strain CCMP 410" /LENGTH=209 /DNA_ID=CAMNT_0038692819 /DNA_START=122 /DNA_END=751 /DNA_ORIENTATION=+
MDLSTAISESFSFGYPSGDGNSSESSLSLYQFCEELINTTFATTQGESPLVPIVHERPMNESGIAEASTPLRQSPRDGDEEASLDSQEFYTPTPSVVYCSSSSSFDPTKCSRNDSLDDYMLARSSRQRRSPAVRITSRPLAIACGFDPLLDNEGRRVVVVGRSRSDSTESAGATQGKENQQYQLPQQHNRSPWRPAKSDSRLLLPDFEK